VSIQRFFLVTGLVVVSWSLTSGQNSTARQAIKSGNALVAQEKYEAAIKEFERVKATDSERYSQSVYNIGVCYYELWLTDKAIEFFLRAVELKRGNYARASFALGVALEDEKRFSEAKDAYRQVLLTSKDGYPAATFRLGVLAVYEDQTEQAVRLFQAAAKHPGPHVASSHNNLGVMLARMGKLQMAEEEFIRALSNSDGSFRDAQYNLILCRSLMQTALNDDSFQDLKLALIERQPQNREAKVNLEH